MKTKKNKAASKPTKKTSVKPVRKIKAAQPEKVVRGPVKAKVRHKPEKPKGLKIQLRHEVKSVPQVTPKIGPVIAEKVVRPQKPLTKEPQILEEPKVIIKEEKPALKLREVKPAVKEAKPAVVEEKKPAAPPIVPAPVKLQELQLSFPIALKELAVKLQQKPSLLIKKMLDKGLLVGINQNLQEEVAVELARSFGYEIKKALGFEELVLRIHQQPDPAHLLKFRPPVVTFMGHVDHGKTSLLDYIRKSKVVESEHGGITQHMGAYQVTVDKEGKTRKISFLDTPGHEAFTKMRLRGAQITDIVVLVVAADDGVMPQTVEAIDHAKEAGVPVVVAINKIDKPQINLDRVKKQLSELGLVSEEWQGKTIMVGVSAKTGQGIDELLEMILLEAEMLELKANYNKLARGVVIEAQLSRDRGPIVNLLVQSGTLHINDNLIIGRFYGKAKAMFDDYGRPLKEAYPSSPVLVLGLQGAPEAGEQFYCVEDEKEAREIAQQREEKARLGALRAVERISLEQLYTQIKEGQIKELKIIIKADGRGSLEAIKDALRKAEIPEIKFNIIHEGVGSINTSDAILAVASNALILGFSVDADSGAKEVISKEGVELRTYNIIYELTNELKAAMEGMLEPKIKQVFLGRVEVRKVFKITKAGVVAGCFVSKGKILRSCEVHLVRNSEVVFKGKISSLKRFKDDVREVTEGLECGISLAGFEDIQVGDIIEAYEIQKIARKL